MRHRSVALGIVLVLVVAVAESHATPIAFFNDATYVSVSGEAAKLRAELVGLGHTVSDFTGTTAAEWATALSGADLVVIPELPSASLSAALTPGARSEILSFVSSGGGMLTNDSTNPSYSDNSVDLLNVVFGYALAGTGSSGSSSLDAGAAAGTAFAGGPASLPDSNATEGLTTASLPSGALSIYTTGGGTVTTVFTNAEGLGHVTHLGFDWYQTPAPAAWVDVLDRAVGHSDTAPIPEPTSMALLALGGLGLLARRRRRRA